VSSPYIKPRKRPRKEFRDIRSLNGLSNQELSDFSFNDPRLFFKVRLWDRSHTCCFIRCPHPLRKIETFEEATLDHILPKSAGGRTRLANLQLMHRECNGAKGHDIPAQYSPLARIPTDSHKHYLRDPQQHWWKDSAY
jgi:HNH endonuclease